MVFPVQPNGIGLVSDGGRCKALLGQVGLDTVLAQTRLSEQYL